MLHESFLLAALTLSVGIVWDSGSFSHVAQSNGEDPQAIFLVELLGQFDRFAFLIFAVGKQDHRLVVVGLGKKRLGSRFNRHA